ncbi:MAG: DUF3302 domain-containing protein [Thiohalomonadales bacterium]
MSFIDFFSWFVLLVMIGTFIAIFVFMGLWPGMIAKKRLHPQAEAIQIGSWVTLIMGFALWPVILIWAYTKPSSAENITVKGAGK